MKYRLALLIIAVIPVMRTMGQGQGQGQDQHNYILVNGVVMDASSTMPLSNAHFVINRGYGGVSDDEGRFSLYLDRGDTVIFSYIGYSDALFTIPDTVAVKRLVAGIFLNEDTLSVGEVVVFPAIADLRTEIMTGDYQLSRDEINAQNNIAISTYQGINSAASLGDPQANYEVLRRKQILDAYEKGGIPSDKMISLNPITFIPGVIYIIAKGLPERPESPMPSIKPSEFQKMKELYRQNMERRRKENR